MGSAGEVMPYNLRLILLWIMTANFSFTIVYTIEFIFKTLSKVLKGTKKEIESSNVLVN